jgi:putative ABC transport system permease protein
MIRVALKGLLGRKLRAILTAFAIVLGVAMISGSFVLTDTLGASLDGVYQESYQGTDAVISSKHKVQQADGTSEKASFSAGVLGDIEQVDGVRAAQGSIEDHISLVDKSGKRIGKPDDGIAVAVSNPDDTSLSPVKVVAGTWPRHGGEIAIDKATATKHHFVVGQTIGAFGQGPVQRYTISGLITFGSADSLAGATLTVLDLATAEHLFHKQAKFDLIRIGADDGVSEATLVQRLTPKVASTLVVNTAEAQAASDSKATQEGLSLFKYILIGFGGIALFVGSFVIANTLAITVAQRMRELATLRTLGASRRQVLGSVVLESLAIGLVGSVIGLFLGLAIALGLMTLLGSIGVQLPDSSLVFSTRTVIVSLAVGTLIALLASLRPAIRATRIEPIAAVREGATFPKSRFARYAVPVSLLISTIAVGLFSYGMLAHNIDLKVRLVSLIAGVLFLFVGVAMVAARVVRPLAFVVGSPGARFGGVAGRLARQNAVRNPSRTASTAAAVMIGLALITFVAVIGQGVRSSFSSAVNQLFVGDYAISGDSEQPLTNKVALAAAKAPGVSAVSELRHADGRIGTKKVMVTGVDRNMSKTIDVAWKDGSDEVPAQLGRNGAFVDDRYAKDHSLQVGSPIALKTQKGMLALHVIGIFDLPKGGSPFGVVTVSLPTFDRSFANRVNDLTLVNVRGGASAAASTRLEQGLAAFPDVKVETRDEFKASQLHGLTQMLNILYLLLGLSVIVSLFGVINTLVLSVFERTREIGMLRAIGMTRRQVRRMIRHESIVTALIGAALGIGVGMFLAAVTTTALSKYGVVFAVPYGSLAVFVAIAVLAGILAAILPARRASRLNVLEALQYE